ncbi:MAG: lysophospholipid acyltransferase family protein [Oscillospiraceae bacterium]
MENAASNNKQKGQRRPFAPFYILAAFFVSVYLRLVYGLRLSQKLHIKGPAIVLCNHPSGLDYLVAIAALFPARLNFIVAYYYFLGNTLAKTLDIMGAIPKYQFTPDIKALRKVGNVLHKKNGIVCMMPEGTVYGNAKLSFINPSVIKFIKHFNVPVYTVNISGAGVCFPKWAKENRRGKLFATVEKLFDPSEFKGSDNELLYHRLVDALSYDDFSYIEKSKFTCHSKKKAEGLERLLSICPSCGREFTLETSKNTISCSCGLCAEIDSSFGFLWHSSPKYFKHYGEWYDYQGEFYKNQIMRDDFSLSSQVIYITNEPSTGSYVKIGEGVITLTREGVAFSGTVRGQKHSFFEPLHSIPAIVIDIGKNFELPYDGGVRCFEPLEKKSAIKWSLCHRLLYDTFVGAEPEFSALSDNSRKRHRSADTVSKDE